jgi:hypothetical protein
VAGQKRRVILLSKDIGPGGMFLRTDNPAPVFKKVKLAFDLPTGGRFEVSGEVVRSIMPDKAKAAGQPPGMAVAFDEVSKRKQKELVTLVLELSVRPAAPEPASVTKLPRLEVRGPPEPARPKIVDPKPAAPAVPAAPPPAAPKRPEPVEAPVAKPGKPKSSIDRSSAEKLLDEIDGLLGAVKKPEKSAPVAPPKPVNAPATKEGELQAKLDDYRNRTKGDTYYDTLGVDLTASGPEIEAAYQKLVGRFTLPASADSLPGSLMEELTSVLGKIQKAYAILSKPDRKRAYDFLIDNDVSSL